MKPVVKLLEDSYQEGQKCVRSCKFLPKFSRLTNKSKNKPGTSNVGAISKAQNCKRGDPLGFLKLQLVAQKKLKVDPLETLSMAGAWRSG